MLGFDDSLDRAHPLDAADAFAAAHLRRNFTALALDYGFFGLGMSLSSTATVLPALANRLGASNLILGALPNLILLGRALPALFSARLIEPLPRKLPFVLTYTVWERLPWLALAAAVYLLTNSNPGLVLALLVGTLAAVALVGGSLTPAWTDLVAKVIPTTYRGRFFAVGSAFSTGLGLLGALFSGYLLLEYPFPVGYTLCLGATFLCLMASYGSMAMAREPATGTDRRALPLSLHLARLPRILGRNPSFAWYLGARALSTLGMMSMAFYTVHALRSLDAQEWNVAGFTFAMLAAQAAGGVALGVLADHVGHRASLLVGALAASAANALALAAGDLLLFHGAFLLMGLSVAATNVSSLTLVLELAEADERPLYLGVATAAQGPFALFSPLLAAGLADALGLGAIFAVAGLLNGLSVALYLWRVEEPRHAPRLKNEDRTG